MANRADKETFEEKNYENAVLYLLEQLGYTRIDEPGYHEVKR